MITKRQRFNWRWEHKWLVGGITTLLPAAFITTFITLASISSFTHLTHTSLAPTDTIAVSAGIDCAFSGTSDACKKAADIIASVSTGASKPKTSDTPKDAPKSTSKATPLSPVPAAAAPLKGVSVRHLDLANWTSWTSTQTGATGWGNNELQNYTSSPDNVRFENGKLIIQARGSSGKYTSARLDSHGKLDIGPNTRIDVTAKLPSGRGTWPAIWLWRPGGIAGATDPEIDIMEFVGAEPGQIYSSAHSANHYPGSGVRSASKSIPSASSSFHVYSIVWKDTYLETWVDNQRIMRVDSSPDVREWPYTQPMHFILNLAIGGSWGGMNGIDDASVGGWVFEISDISLQQL